MSQATDAGAQRAIVETQLALHQAGQLGVFDGQLVEPRRDRLTTPQPGSPVTRGERLRPAHSARQARSPATAHAAPSTPSTSSIVRILASVSDSSSSATELSTMP